MKGAWKDALIDIDRGTEFTGDDVDRYSKLVDLGADFDELTVKVPTIDSAQVTVYGQLTPAIDEVPVPIHFFHDIDADTDVVQSSVAGTGGIILTFKLGGLQFIRIYTSANMTADRTFKVRGN